MRQSTALTYLAGTRDRPNLSLRSDALVDRVELDGARAVGVRLADSGEVIDAGRVVLASGAYGSPTILMRTGIGSAGQLRAVGVDPVLDRPGVGANLTEHPLMPNAFEATPPPRAGDPVFEALLTTASSTADGVYDLHVLPLFNPPELQGDAPVLVILTSVMTPKSTGSVRLRSADAHDCSIVEQHLQLAVHGIDGLSVIDASIMPTIPAANTNVPTIMIAERCAAWLRGEEGP